MLLKKLADTGWEIVEKSDNTDWWLEEYWKIRSIHQNWGKVIYVLFLVDPQYEGTKKSQAVWAIVGSKEIPSNRPMGDEGIAEIDLSKGKLDLKLNEFVQGIDEYRNNS